MNSKSGGESCLNIASYIECEGTDQKRVPHIFLAIHHRDVDTLDTTLPRRVLHATFYPYLLGNLNNKPCYLSIFTFRGFRRVQINAMLHIAEFVF